MAHGKDEPDLAIQIATAVFAAAVGLDDERAALYSDLVHISLSEAAQRSQSVVSHVRNAAIPVQ